VGEWQGWTKEHDVGVFVEMWQKIFSLLRESTNKHRCCVRNITIDAVDDVQVQQVFLASGGEAVRRAVPQCIGGGDCFGREESRAEHCSLKSIHT